MWTYTTDSMDFVTVSTGLISPYWMGLPIRYIHVAACVYISGYGIIIGSLCIGAIFAMAVIGLYYLYYDNSTK